MGNELTKQEVIDRYITKTRMLGLEIFELEITNNRIVLCGFKDIEKSKLEVEKLVVPEIVDEISSGAFMGSRLQEVHFNDELKYIGGNAFHSCKELKYTSDIPIGVKSLYRTFKDKIKIPYKYWKTILK